MNSTKIKATASQNSYLIYARVNTNARKYENQFKNRNFHGVWYSLQLSLFSYRDQNRQVSKIMQPNEVREQTNFHMFSTH